MAGEFDTIYVHSPGDVPLAYGEAEVVWSFPLPDSVREAYGLTPYSQAEYRDALAALLPEGEAWPRNTDSTLMRLLNSLAAEFERLDSRGAQLLAEGFAATTAELLGDWEVEVGLPDPCVTTAQTVAERRAALEARLTSVGGQSRAFFLDLAARLGYTVTIDEFKSATEATAAGVVFTGSQWAHIWRVNVPTAVGVTPFRAGAGSAGEPLRAWGNQVIECQFNRHKPAHTQVLFAYPA